MGGGSLRRGGTAGAGRIKGEADVERGKDMSNPSLPEQGTLVITTIIAVI